MKKIYYDVVEKFAKDLKERIPYNVVVKKDTNELIVGKESLKFEEENIGIRSFSVPYFVKNQTIIQYEGNNKELMNKIENICTAYTDKEIEAIVQAMPILKSYSQKRKESLKNVAIIWRDHFLEENIGLLISFVRMGVKPRDILAIDKGDSTKHRKEITETFKKLGYEVNILDNTAVSDDILIEDGKKLIKEFIEKRKDKEIVILDDGAIVSRILN